MNTRTHIQPNVSRLKRIIDFTIALIVLLLTWPLFIAIAILVKLTSKGPVIYSQKRLDEFYRIKPTFLLCINFAP